MFSSRHVLDREESTVNQNFAFNTERDLPYSYDVCPLFKLVFYPDLTSTISHIEVPKQHHYYLVYWRISCKSRLSLFGLWAGAFLQCFIKPLGKTLKCLSSTKIFTASVQSELRFGGKWQFHWFESNQQEILCQRRSCLWTYVMKIKTSYLFI